MPTGELKSKRISLRVSEEDYNLIKDTAIHYNIPITDYIMNRVFSKPEPIEYRILKSPPPNYRKTYDNSGILYVPESGVH